jgi:uncharacterized protein YcbK (DUF882 family)
MADGNHAHRPSPCPNVVPVNFEVRPPPIYGKSAPTMKRRRFLALTAAAAVWPLAGARAVPHPSQLRRVHLFNPHTGETFSGPYRDDSGPIVGAMKELCVFLRDFHSGQEAQIDIGVIDFLTDVLAAVGETRATILSAYRTRATNEMLARTIFGVAENSQHVFGRALDVSLDARLADAVSAARAMHRGGVGWYPRSGFFHIDCGPPRNWTLDGTGFRHLLLFDGRRLGFGALRRPLTIAERLTLHHELARAELLARLHQVGLKP